jgi:simple sugar transport system permease protein
VTATAKASSSGAQERPVEAFARRAAGAALPPVAGFAFALFVGALIVLLAHKWPHEVFLGFVSNFSGYDFGEVLYLTTVYTFTGLSVAYAFQGGLFNIGGEGQLLIGGFVLGIFAAALPGDCSPFVAVPLSIGVAFAAGAGWAAGPAVLRAKLGVHEVLSTILMNLIAPSVTVFALNRYREAHKVELFEAMHTLPIVEGARIQQLDELARKMPWQSVGDWLADHAGGDASVAITFAVIAAIVAKWAIVRTRGGYELRAVGQNVEAAAANGVRVPAVMTKALLVSGGLAGLASVPFVLGSKHYFEQGMLAGAGFMGIAVAVLAGNDPLRVLLAAFSMAFLTQAGEVVNGNRPDQVPKEIVQVLEAVVIVSVLVAQGIARRALARAEARRAKRGE